MASVYVGPGYRVQMEGCFSEVMMHFGLAGRPIEAELVAQRNLRGDVVEDARPMAQIYVDGKPFSYPILPGEAGFYEDSEGFYYHPASNRVATTETTFAEAAHVG